MARKSAFRKTVFGNGLTLLTERHPEFRSLSIGVWVKVGTRHEKAREAGVSHFLEHMLFKGTKTRSALDIARQVDQVGGDFNAFTAREYTCFHILLLNRDIGLGMDILSDVILNSDFSREEFERERKVILQEIAMVDETPEELAHDLFFEKVYPKHGLGRPILGTEKSVRELRRADLVRYFQRHYRPDQMIISVAGDITHEQVRRKLAPLLKSRWPGRPARTAVASSPLLAPPKIKDGSWWIQRNTEQAHLLWGVEGPHYRSRDRFAAFLLNVYLGGGMSSALFQEIREKNGLAYSVYSSLTPFTDSGVFSVYAGTGVKQIPLCLKLIEESVSKLQKTLLTELELTVIKDNLKGTILLSSDSAESRMCSMAKNEIVFGKYYNPEQVCALVDEVSAEDVRRMARKLLRGGKRSLLVVGPKPSKAVAASLKSGASRS